ncbi:MazG-like pyrophosphatase [Stenotrophomonas phage Siara]|uniref:MazG-like nucleotide pyrophosphohydrolase n=1 Tax=Stenotrophomonas phage Siara TaxID=2859658 RepID=A0AAE7WN20_9CAUD|nr:MazG-like pyrophosphatase [Stenotrophomonas phage Siara]QYW02075.1 MazG-like nucleotide pyrophosphohydrolase [Stenotrophomonas phage Siara]
MNYIEAANATNTDAFHEGMTQGVLLELLTSLLEVGGTLDAVKKYQFYGRKTEETQGILDYSAHTAVFNVDPDADVNPYIEEIDFAKLLPGFERHQAIRVYHAIIGQITEAVELGQALRDAIRDGTPLDPVNLLEETGDTLWYIAGLLRVLGKTFDDAKRVNIAKLNKRYPNGTFDAYLAQQENRDLTAERKVLEGEGVADKLEELRNSPVVQAMSLDEQSEVLSNARAQLDRA